jgi:hypothetical protein
MDLEASVLFVAQGSKAPIDASTKLKTKRKKKRPTSKPCKLSNDKETRSKTYRIGRPIHTKRLGALPVADAPDKDVIHPRRHLLLGDLALVDPGGVGLPLVHVRQVYPVLDMLY